MKLKDVVSYAMTGNEVNNRETADETGKNEIRKRVATTPTIIRVGDTNYTIHQIQYFR